MSTDNTKTAIQVIIDPFQRFFRLEASGGILLLFSTIVALVWANSPWSKSYLHFWETHLTIDLGFLYLSKTYLHWINDGLMAIFFFFVGLEIKREIIAGELSSIKQSSLPIAAAIGGMLFPALIFTSVNKDPLTAAGWGIPMATDIAFSLGVLSLLGKRVPTSLKIFLVAFAIVDDLGAVLVIALFYSSELHWAYLLIGLGLFLVLMLFNRFKLYYIPAYMVVGWVIWYMFYKSGIHPTIAGVLIAFSIPMNRRINVGTFSKRMDRNLQSFCPADCNDKLTLTGEQLAAVDNMHTELKLVQSPVQSLEHTLAQFVTFIVMPLFALANAGVEIHAHNLGTFLAGLSGSIELSLALGKVVGITLFTWLAVKIGIGALPEAVRWIHILGVGLLGGMGFTMSLFIANLAFIGDTLLNPAKIGILVGSLIAGISGYLVLKITLDKEYKAEQA